MVQENDRSNASAPKAEKENTLLESLKKIKHKFIVMSGKGGVGKTSTCVNIALALSMKKYKVGIVDVDLHGPDVPRMLGLKQPIDITHDNKIKPLVFSEYLKAVSIESMMPDRDHSIIWRGPVKYSAIQQFIGDVAWGELDFLLIDAPPGTGDEPLTIAQSIKDAKAIIVTTPQKVSLADVKKSISFCKTVQMDILGMVENMSGLLCPHCKSELPFFGMGGGKALAEELSIPFIGQVPFDQNMTISLDEGDGYQERFIHSPAYLAFSEIVNKIDAFSSRCSA